MYWTTRTEAPTPIGTLIGTGLGATVLGFSYGSAAGIAVGVFVGLGLLSVGIAAAVWLRARHDRMHAVMDEDEWERM